MRLFRSWSTAPRTRLSIDMAIGILYVEELRATMRGRFALLGAGVMLLAVGCVATVGTQDTWLDGYGIIAYFLVPLAFVPLAAVFLASPRANRFVESVFTAPVDRRDWLTAKILVVITIAAAYYVALVPMVLVYAHHVGVPLLLQKLLIWAPRPARREHCDGHADRGSVYRPEHRRSCCDGHGRPPRVRGVRAASGTAGSAR